MPSILIAATIFLSVGLLAWAGLSLVFSDDRRVSKRLAALTAYESGQAGQAYPQLKPFTERMVKPGAAQMRESVASLAPSSYRGRVRQRLVLAGSPRGMDADRLVVIKVLLSVGVGTLAIGSAIVFSASGLAWMFAVAFSILAFFAPDLWLSNRIEERKKEIRVGLPDMLDMLVISIEAGLGFDQAIAKIVQTTRGALPKELARSLQEMQAGADRSSALRSLAARTEVPELNAFITAIVQADQLGIPIGNVLRTQASEMRLTRRQRAEEQAQKTPVKIVFPLILCILPATMIVILGPAAVSIGQAFGAW